MHIEVNEVIESRSVNFLRVLEMLFEGIECPRPYNLNTKLGARRLLLQNVPHAQENIQRCKRTDILVSRGVDLGISRNHNQNVESPSDGDRGCECADVFVYRF